MLSLAHLTVMKAGPVELIEIAARAGFDAIGLRLQPPMPGDVVVPVVGEAETQRAIKQRLRDTGVKLLDVEAFWIMPDSDLAEFRRGFETGAELGANFALIVGNDPDQARLTERFAQLCEHARACSLTPMLEFIPYSAVQSLAAADALVKAAGVDNARLLVDALHLSRSGGSPADLAAYPAELFRYMHLCDAPAKIPPTAELRPEARGARLYPGEGGLWLDEFLAAFPEGTPAAVEAPSARHAHLPLAEQASLAAKAARSVLDQAEKNRRARAGG